jgi:hypothetical protein
MNHNHQYQTGDSEIPPDAQEKTADTQDAQVPACIVNG